ncbi:MAG: methylated-DNA--[protein]-cysteine S-methyltransferase [Candidatus Eremiobacteraeota bacterium]|nr:methylated-DNA--[protein]-cysteine S-methyltransferase [Candidatus Eremiobacteraeota bacterium]
MRCSDVEALWDDLRAGLEPRSEHAIAHLRRCKDCQAVYEQYEGVAYCLTCLPRVEPPESLVPRILDHIKALRNRYRSKLSDAVARVESPLGDLWIAWRESGITFVGIDRGLDEETALEHIERRLSRPLRRTDLPPWVEAAVRNFFTTWQVDMSRIDISDLSAFEQSALRKAAQIPPGEVRSYGWIAREIGHPQAARAVGQAMARNPVALLFPCHRVVDASGALHNYGYGVEVKARILEMEGYVKSAR